MGQYDLYIIHIEFYTIFNYNLIYHIMSMKYNNYFEVNQKINIVEIAVIKL